MLNSVYEITVEGNVFFSCVISYTTFREGRVDIELGLRPGVQVVRALSPIVPSSCTVTPCAKIIGMASHPLIALRFGVRSHFGDSGLRAMLPPAMVGFPIALEPCVFHFRGHHALMHDD